ncbi:MAG: hypothetical protein ACRENX_03350, partial [Candidatus Dormibacteria bacterium]
MAVLIIALLLGAVLTDCGQNRTTGLGSSARVTAAKTTKLPKPESTDEGHGAVQGNRGRSWRVVGGRDISQRVLHDLKVASNV